MSSKMKILLFVAAGSSSLAMATAANAGTTADCVAGAGSKSTECGVNSTTSTAATPPVDATNATAVGDTSTATGNNSTAVTPSDFR